MNREAFDRFNMMGSAVLHPFYGLCIPHAGAWEWGQIPPAPFFKGGDGKGVGSNLDY